MQVNRYLKNKAMDNIDHALGRPVDPMVATYRNHFAAHVCEAGKFREPQWVETHRDFDLVFFQVTPAGRRTLRDYLRSIGDTTRLFIVRYMGSDMSPVPAKSHSAARYAAWLSWDTNELTFGQFIKHSNVRLARDGKAAHA